MRYVLALALMAVAGCAKPTPLEQSRATYMGCLNAKPVEQCQNEKARLDADIAVTNAQANRMAAQPPLVLSGWTPPQSTPVVRQPLTCTTNLGVTQCY